MVLIIRNSAHERGLVPPAVDPSRLESNFNLTLPWIQIIARTIPITSSIKDLGAQVTCYGCETCYNVFTGTQPVVGIL